MTKRQYGPEWKTGQPVACFNPTPRLNVVDLVGYGGGNCLYIPRIYGVSDRVIAKPHAHSFVSVLGARNYTFVEAHWVVVMQ